MKAGHCDGDWYSYWGVAACHRDGRGERGGGGGCWRGRARAGLLTPKFDTATWPFLKSTCDMESGDLQKQQKTTTTKTTRHRVFLKIDM